MARSWLGPLCFGLALQYTGSYRVAILSLVLLFTLGLVLFLRIDVRRAIREAGNDIPVGVSIPHLQLLPEILTNSLPGK